MPGCGTDLFAAPESPKIVKRKKRGYGCDQGTAQDGVPSQLWKGFLATSCECLPSPIVRDHRDSRYCISLELTLEESRNWTVFPKFRLVHQESCPLEQQL